MNVVTSGALPCMGDTGSGVKVELGPALTVAHRVGRTAVNVVLSDCRYHRGPALYGRYRVWGQGGVGAGPDSGS